VNGVHTQLIKLIDRNYFGVIRVVEFDKNQRALIHGTTTHGTNAATRKKYETLKLSYYSDYSPLADIFAKLKKRKDNQKIAVLGLGVGVTACYTQKNRSFDFFEIDKDIADIAENPQYFTYLKNCGSPYQIILGDARLTMNDQTNNIYDVIILDAFSSDNIPAHLLTTEAIKIYLKKLKPNGILVFHISNNALDLEPILTAIGQKINIKTIAKISNNKKIKDTPFESYPSHYLLFMPDTKDIKFFEQKGWSVGMNRDGVNAWTDRYSNIISILSPIVSNKRYNMQKEKEETDDKTKLEKPPQKDNKK
jgi:hypothetical protein